MMRRRRSCLPRCFRSASLFSSRSSPTLEATQGQILSQSPLFEEAFVRELTKETIVLPGGCPEKKEEEEDGKLPVSMLPICLGVFVQVLTPSFISPNVFIDEF